MYQIKLVRDKIPDKIKSNGGDPDFYIAEDIEYLERLVDKVKEEFEEVLSADDDNIVEELGDFKETILAVLDFKSIKIPQKVYVEINTIINLVLDIINHRNIDEVDIESARIKKYEKLGGFKNKIILKIPKK